MTADHEELAYIACFFDCEGSVTITSRGRGDGGGLHLVVCLVNTDRLILEWIRSRVGFGNIYIRSRAGSLGKKPCHVLQYSHKAAADFLRMILPSVRLKFGQAKIAIEFQDTMRRRGRKGTPKEIHDERGRLQAQLRVVR